MFIKSTENCFLSLDSSFAGNSSSLGAPFTRPRLDFDVDNMTTRRRHARRVRANDLRLSIIRDGKRYDPRIPWKGRNEWMIKVDEIDSIGDALMCAEYLDDAFKDCVQFDEWQPGVDISCPCCDTRRIPPGSSTAKAIRFIKALMVEYLDHQYGSKGEIKLTVEMLRMLWNNIWELSVQKRPSRRGYCSLTRSCSHEHRLHWAKDHDSFCRVDYSNIPDMECYGNKLSSLKFAEGLTRLLGVQMEWGHFKALFHKICGKRSYLNFSAFCRAFGDQDQRDQFSPGTRASARLAFSILRAFADLDLFLPAAFQLFDRNGDGICSCAEFMRAAAELHPSASTAEIRCLWEALSSRVHGKSVSEHRFLDFFGRMLQCIMIAEPREPQFQRSFASAKQRMRRLVDAYYNPERLPHYSQELDDDSNDRRHRHKIWSDHRIKPRGKAMVFNGYSG